MREQLELTAILLGIALLSSAMFLFPVEKKKTENTEFLEMWWDNQGSLALNKLDSLEIYSLPVAISTKRSLWFRARKNWPIADHHELFSDTYYKQDSLFFALGQLDFSVHAPRQVSKEKKNHYSKHDFIDVTKAQKPVQYTAVDLNWADSSALERIPGIGPGMIRLLESYKVNYGFVADVNHLKNTTFFGEQWRPEWDSLLFIDSIPAPTISLAHSSFKELLAFPDFNYKQIKRLCFYRESFGVPYWKEIIEWEEFSEIDTIFLKHYISRN